MINDDDDDLIGGADVARLLGVDRARISRYETRGWLPLGREEWQGRRRRPLYRRADVEKLKSLIDARTALRSSSDIV